jgi:putative inorganic carbon (HCO3(-)) transporter
MMLLFYFYFLGVMTSISLMDGFSSFLFLGLLFLVFAKKFKPFSLGLWIFFGPWILINVVSLVVNHPNIHWGDGLADMKWMFLIPVVAWSADSFDFKRKFQLKNIRYVYIPILLVSFYAILITALGFDPLRPYRSDLQMISGGGGIRTPGFLGNPMTFAHAYGVLFCILWAFCLYLITELKYQISKFDYIGVMISFLFSAIAIFLSFTRGAWISISLALFVITYLFKPKWGKLVIFTGIAVLVLSFIFIPTIRLRLIDATKIEDTQTDRMNLWKANLMMFRDYPLTGVGYGENFYNLNKYFDKMGLPQNSFKSHAHNQFLQLLGGTGIFGLMMYLLFLGHLARRAYTKWRQSFTESSQKNILVQALALGVLAAVIHVFFGGIFEANFEDSETLHMFCFFVGLFLYCTKKTPDLEA